MIGGVYFDFFVNLVYQGVVDVVIVDVLLLIYCSYVGGGQFFGLLVESEVVVWGLLWGFVFFVFGYYGQECGFQEVVVGWVLGLVQVDYGDFQVLLGVGVVWEGMVGQ